MTITVFGAGAWGTAIAKVLADKNKVTIYAREKEVVAEINNTSENKTFMPDVKLPPNLIATNSVKDVLKSEYIFMVTPSQYLRHSLKQFKDKGLVNKDQKFIICSKGIENSTLMLMSEVFEEFFDNTYGILTGPTFAREVTERAKTSICLSTEDKNLYGEIVDIMQTEYFKIFSNNDLVGSQICGALKNVIAISCGTIRGLDGSENARSAAFTRGFKEIMMLNEKLGGKIETLFEPCGIGDLMLTSNSNKSRNYSYGYKLAKNGNSEKQLQVVEGVATAKSTSELGDKHGLDLTLCKYVNNISQGKTDLKEIFNLI